MALPKITEEQLKDELTAGMTNKAIAAKYGMDIRSVERRRSALYKKGFGHGRDVSGLVPDGYRVKGVSSLVDDSGNIRLQWVKSDFDALRLEEIQRAALEALIDDLEPLKNIPLSQKAYRDDLLAQYTVSDYHLGMLAWAEESGDDWDMKIASGLFVQWFKRAMTVTPDAKVAVINLLGDFAHFDGLEAVTNASGHVLDADTRYQKLVRYMISMVRCVIEMALEKHSEVKLMIVQGNHDESGMIWLAEMFKSFYSDNPRIEVDTSPDVFKALQFGKTSLFYHHGHKARFDAIESIMISKFRDIFGSTKYSYAHVGHLHHQKIVEGRNMIVEQHQTLAAKDAYASRGGWMSQRGANVIVYSSEFGEVERYTIKPEMLISK